MSSTASTVRITREQVGNDLKGKEHFHKFGCAVSMSSNGDRVAVGVPSTGHVLVYDWFEGQWVQAGEDLVGETANDSFGRCVVLSSDGNRLAIGGQWNTDCKGHVQIFDWTDRNWAQTGRLEGQEANEGFGWAIALSSDANRIAIGGPGYANGDCKLAGHVQIYDYTEKGWIQVGKDLVGMKSNDGFGKGVALSSNGKRVAIGGPDQTNKNGELAGHVKIYDLVEEDWIQVGDDLIGGTAKDWFGRTVSLSSDGNRVAIGAPGHCRLKGLVQVYQWSEGGWTKVGDDMIGKATKDTFGSALVLSSDGNRIAIGGPGNNNGNGDRSGYVQIYDWSVKGWIQVGDDMVGAGKNDMFGRAVALSSYGRRVAIGAPSNDHVGSGYVQIHDLETRP